MEKNVGGRFVLCYMEDGSEIVERIIFIDLHNYIHVLLYVMFIYRSFDKKMLKTKYNFTVSSAEYKQFAFARKNTSTLTSFGCRNFYLLTGLI